MGTREGLLLGCGNPLLDISSLVDAEFLAKYDMQPNNAILAEEKHKSLYKELVEKYDATFTAGGSVQNSLRVAQWILQKPNVAVFFGCVGRDKYSKILEDEARSDGVNVRYQFTESEPTGTCGVLITGHHRSLCANLAAANCFTIDHINLPENRKYLENAEYFYISGFFLTVSPPSIQAVAKHALARNNLFMMNLSAPFLSQFFKEPLMDAMPYVDIIFGNEVEATTFANEQSFGTTDLREIALKMCSLPKQNEKRGRVVVLTQGGEAVLLAENNKITEIPVEKLDEDKIVDTNGAGDAFVGGFLAQLVQKKSLETCVRCGIWAARQIIQRSGCTFEGAPNFE
ncbi:Adenosine kinase 2 [Pseudolycoriella hygida]|uniref:Adenosine kinase n=1 Tax=Pseudolycoriella hygida TaxID=35572 RepID=A0A9Q0NE63_9DIPT|nr:Adenosine kinase 2 [Pseudolycoriella hygida]